MPLRSRYSTRSKKPMYKKRSFKSLKKTSKKPTKVFKKKVAKVINSMAESKYNHVTHEGLDRLVSVTSNQNDLPVGYHPNKQLTLRGFCFTDANDGTTPANVGADLNMWCVPSIARFKPLNLDACFGKNSSTRPKNAIEGSYISPSMSRCSFVINVPSEPVTIVDKARSQGIPQLFRMIVFSTKEAMNNANSWDWDDYAIADKLFLDQFGESEGYMSTAGTSPKAINSSNLLTKPVNKRLFKVLKDTSFVLQSPPRS